MILIGLAFVIGTVIGWKSMGGDEWFLDGLIAILCGAIAAFVALLIAALIGTCLPAEYVLDHQIELAALNDHSGISGNFFLGCGNIENEFYYVFYRKEPDGSKTFDKIKADKKAKIYEEERNDGIIEAFREDFINKNHWLFAVVFSEPRYKIRIPKGSISKKFKLDLE